MACLFVFSLWNLCPHGSVCLAHSNNQIICFHPYTICLPYYMYSSVGCCVFFFFSVCFFSAGLAHWYPTDPHTIIMAAGPRRSHPRLCPSVKCHRITCGNDSLRCCHAAGTQLAVGQPTTVKDACRLMGFSNLKLNHFQCYFFQVKLE